MNFIEYRDPIVLYKDDIPCTDVGLKIYASNILSSPSKRLEDIEIEGRNGTLTIDNGYEDFILKLSCVIVNENDETQMADVVRKVKKYLLEGTNCKLQTNEDTSFYLLGTYNSKIDIEEAIENFGLFEATFKCKPFRYSNVETVLEITKQPATINNTEYVSNPKITIQGNGNITVNINKQQLILKDIEGTITINCETMNAEKVDSLGNTINLNQKMYSDFPVLEEGINKITWSLGTGATLSKIIIRYKLVVI